MRNAIFVGIDQTGAVNSSGRPHPLPMCAIIDKEIELFYIPYLSKDEILKQIPTSKSDLLFLCADCVLGMPNSLDTTWHSALARIDNSQSYGRKPASDFFRVLGQGVIHRRSIEKHCKANSVFSEKPFQKNIQTGTYRLWKDISAHRADFWVPALESQSHRNQIPLFEGYPSLSWRILFKTQKRDPLNLNSHIKSHFPEMNWTTQHQKKVNKDPNLADAFVLALTMKVFVRDALSLQPNKEGWILGCNR